MLIYYIDDSFFTRSEFAFQMSYKLEVLLRENIVDYVLISVSKNTLREIERFEERLKEYKIKFILSTQNIDIDGKTFLLSNSTLRLPNEEIRCYSGTVCVIDTDTMKWKRLYLDLFPEEETDIITLITEAIEENLGITDIHKNKSKS